MQARVKGVTLRTVAGSIALLMAAGVAMGQVAAPRYQSPIVQAPVPQMTLPAPAPVSSPNAAVVEDVIARVNDQIIDRSEMERAEQQIVEEAQQEHLGRAEVELAQKNLLRDLIDKQLLLSRGKELDLNVDADVVRQLDAIRKQHNFDSMEALEKAVRESGITYEDFKAKLRNDLISQQVVREEVARSIRRPSPKEEQAYYDAHKAELEQPEQVGLGEILIPTPEDATDAQIAQAQAKADEVAAKLKAGAKFDDLAKQYSGGPNADSGGSLGLFKRGTLGKVLEDATFSLKVGDTTPPIRTRQGFVLLKVTEHNPGGVPPLKDVQEQLDDAIFSEQMQPALRKYLTDLREKASIDIAPGFVDSGASPNQTKLVYSAATPLPERKATQQKQRLNPSSTRAAVAPAKTGTAAPLVAGATVPNGPAPAAGASSSSASGASAKTATGTATNTGKKRKKIKREKVRFGQAPRNALPAGPEENLPAGADQGAGATSSALPAPGAAIASISDNNGATPTNVASNADPLAPVVERKKTRYSDRAATEAATKAAAKASKVKQKAAVTPVAMTSEEKTAQKIQDSALGLGGDTAAKKKKKKDKNAPKERIQEKAPAPPKPAPEATPIPPKSVRDNGEPVVSPPPDLSGVPPAQPTTPASPAAPQQ
jgi:peptidyl-prolyl cis-trans isomerase SurA